MNMTSLEEKFPWLHEEEVDVDGYDRRTGYNWYGQHRDGTVDLSYSVIYDHWCRFANTYVERDEPDPRGEFVRRPYRLSEYYDLPNVFTTLYGGTDFKAFARMFFDGPAQVDVIFSIMWREAVDRICREKLHQFVDQYGVTESDLAPELVDRIKENCKWRMLFVADDANLFPFDVIIESRTDAPRRASAKDLYWRWRRTWTQVYGNDRVLTGVPATLGIPVPKPSGNRVMRWWRQELLEAYKREERQFTLFFRNDDESYTEIRMQDVERLHLVADDGTIVDTVERPRERWNAVDTFKSAFMGAFHLLLTTYVLHTLYLLTMTTGYTVQNTWGRIVISIWYIGAIVFSYVWIPYNIKRDAARRKAERAERKRRRENFEDIEIVEEGNGFFRIYRT